MYQEDSQDNNLYLNGDEMVCIEEALIYGEPDRFYYVVEPG